MDQLLTSLHEAILPIMGAALAELRLAGSGRLLDLGCGRGEKLALLLHAAPHAHILALDSDHTALRLHPRQPGRVTCLAADAHALPLADRSIAAACCIAALGAFAHPPQALAELQRAMRPGAPIVVVTSAQRWVARYAWPEQQRHSIASALDQAGAWRAWPAAHPDLAGDLAGLLAGAGFHAPHIRAFPLDSPDPRAAEIELLVPAMLPPAGLPAYLAPPEPDYVFASLALVAIALA